MKHIYSRTPDSCELIKAKPETIGFLMSYSNSLNIVKYKGKTFEGNLN